MNLLREYIRKLLRESAVHPKIMSMIDKAESLNVSVYVRSNSVFFIQGERTKVGGIWWAQDIHDGPCLGAQIVGESFVDHDLGPLAYDVAIEASGGLTPDRADVSQEARAVWDKYMTMRPDVQAFQLDNDHNELTPGNEDNCSQTMAMRRQKASGTPWAESSLSKMYKKSGTPVIDELRSRGMLKE